MFLKDTIQDEDAGVINPAFLTMAGNLMISKKNLDGSKNLFGTPLGTPSLAFPGHTSSTNFKNMATVWKSSYDLPGQIDNEDENKSSLSYGDDRDLDSYF